MWDSRIVPLLLRDEKREIEAKTVLAYLRDVPPVAPAGAGLEGDAREGASRATFDKGLLRTLQRRMRDWRALHGPEKEVFFPLQHVPGREAAVDFTHGTELSVTVQGVLLVHLLFELVLSFSGWTWVGLAFGETFEALLAGLQGAFWTLGGVTAVVRTDNLSAATHELKRSQGRSLTTRFKAVLDHHGTRSTRIKPGESHENGVVEQRHSGTKSAVAQALVIRGSRDFDSVAEYEAFVRAVVDSSHNRELDATKLALDRSALKPLPAARLPAYTTYTCAVAKWSTLRLAKRMYSVPARLIGHEVEVRQYPDTIDVFYRDKHVETMPRLRGAATARIDYRHIIWSLVRKPGAFARYRYREELFPSLTFRRAYDGLKQCRGDRADVEYVRILHLAASTMEATVEAALTTVLETGAAFDYAAVRAIASPAVPEIPVIAIPAPDLTTYDALLQGVA